MGGSLTARSWVVAACPTLRNSHTQKKKEERKKNAFFFHSPDDFLLQSQRSAPRRAADGPGLGRRWLLVLCRVNSDQCFNTPCECVCVCVCVCMTVTRVTVRPESWVCPGETSHICARRKMEEKKKKKKKNSLKMRNRRVQRQRWGAGANLLIYYFFLILCVNLAQILALSRLICIDIKLWIKQYHL